MITKAATYPKRLPVDRQVLVVGAQAVPLRIAVREYAALQKLVVRRHDACSKCAVVRHDE